jgi:hypothetical protein
LSKVATVETFDTLNAGLSYGLVVELTVYDADQNQLSECAFRWLTEGVHRFHGSDVLRDAGYAKVSHAGFTRVPALRPNGGRNRWAYAAAAPQGTFEIRYNPYVVAAVPWIRRVIDERAESISVRSGEYINGGEIGDADLRLLTTFDSELAEYVKLVLWLDEVELLDPARAASTQERLLGLVQWAGAEFNTVFGHVSYEHAGGMTELERFLRGEVSDPTANTPRWRSSLRGYSWLTVISADIGRMLGGENALLGSGAFHAVSTLPNGSLLLQATPTFREYRGQAVRNVHRALREVLVTGEFRKPSSLPGVPPADMVVLPG